MNSTKTYKYSVISTVLFMSVLGMGGAVYASKKVTRSVKRQEKAGKLQAMLEALKTGNELELQHLLEKVSVQEKQVLLHEAIDLEEESFVKVLLLAGANPFLKNEKGTSPLHRADDQMKDFIYQTLGEITCKKHLVIAWVGGAATLIGGTIIARL